MSRSKKTYLSYIEETPKHYPLLKKVVAKGVRESVAASKDQGLYITYREGDRILREYPDGKKEVIGNLENEDIRVEVGAKRVLS